MKPKLSEAEKLIAKAKREKWEDLFRMQLLSSCAIPVWTKEWQFDAKRKWRFDFAWPSLGIAVEIEGGVYSNGRHTRGSGFEKDLDKYNAATIQGWKVLRVSSGMVKSGAALQLTEQLFRALPP